MEAKLIVVGGQLEPNEFTLSLPMEIGRGPESDIVIPDTLVSRRHARIYAQDGLLFVQDHDSLNGTFVNDRRISTPEIIKPNELLTLGTLTFRAIYDSQHSVDSQTGKQTIGRPVSYDTVRFDESLKETMVIDQPQTGQDRKPQPITKTQADKLVDLPTKTLDEVREEQSVGTSFVTKLPISQANLSHFFSRDLPKNRESGFDDPSAVASIPIMVNNQESSDQEKSLEDKQWLEQIIKIPR